jgi:hypothetical protein
VARAIMKAPMQIHRWMKRFDLDPDAWVLRNAVAFGVATSLRCGVRVARWKACGGTGLSRWERRARASSERHVAC